MTLLLLFLFGLMGYVHHGTEHYLNAYGNYRKPTGWQLV